MATIPQVKVRVSDTPENSTFRFGNGRYVDFESACAELVKAKVPFSEAPGMLQEYYKNACSNLTTDARVVIPEMTEDMVELFWAFKWHSSEDGSRSEYVRSKPGTEIYTWSRDPILSAHALEWRDGRTLIECMNDRYIALAQSGKLPYIDVDDGDSASGDEDSTQKMVKIPTLADYWTTHIYKMWSMDSRFRLESMPTELTDDPEVPAFYCFDHDDLEEGEHPNWDSWLTRMDREARPVFRAWIYSIFDPDNKGRQLIWLQDRGYSGKSSVINAIQRYMGGKGVASISKDSMSDKFGYSQIFGKRLVVYGDTKNPKLLHSEKIHSLLGGDPVQIEKKYADAFTAEIHAKVMVASNIPPEVDLGARNEITRLIFIPLFDPPLDVMKQYCQLDENGDIVRYPDGTPKYVGGNLADKLFAEMNAFLHTCEKDYWALCPNRRDIPLPDKLYETLNVSCPSPEHVRMEHFIEERLEFSEEAVCHPMDLEKAFKEFNKQRPSPFEMGKLNSYLETLGCRKMKQSGKRIWKGLGIVPKRHQAGSMPT